MNMLVRVVVKAMEPVTSVSKSGKSRKSSKSGKSAKTATSVYGGLEYDKTPTTSRITIRRKKDTTGKLKFDNDELIRRLEENIQKESLPVKSIKSEFGKEGKSIKGMQSTSTNNEAKYGKSSKSGEPTKTAASISKGVNKFYGSLKVNQNAAAVSAKPDAVEMNSLELRTEPKEMTYKANGGIQSFNMINKAPQKKQLSATRKMVGTIVGAPVSSRVAAPKCPTDLRGFAKPTIATINRRETVMARTPSRNINVSRTISLVRSKPGCSSTKRPIVILGTPTAKANPFERVETPQENRSSRLRIEHMEKMRKQNSTRIHVRPPNARARHLGLFEKNK